MQPNQPSVTPAQIIAVLIAGIPAVAKLLAAFSVYTLTAAQQAAVGDALTWLGVVAGVLIAADTALRAARNRAHAQIESAPKPIVIPPPPAPVKPSPMQGETKPARTRKKGPTR